jgi:diguanylate cyclase (GGDEF)-like protein
VATAVHFDLDRRYTFVDLHTQRVALLFGALLIIHVLDFLVFGTSRTGLGLSESILVIDTCLAIVCAWIAFRRAQGITAMFWFLFVGILVILLIPTAIQACDTIFGRVTLSDSTRGLLYCLYGAPIVMMLFLPEAHRRGTVKSEIFLDFFQVAIVVALIYSTFFFVPVQQMSPDDALRRNTSISDAQDLLLLVAACVRLGFARTPSTRTLFLRLSLFVLVCGVVTYVGDWFFLNRNATMIAWFDLGWAVPHIAAGLIAITWTPSVERHSERRSAPEPTNFLGFLGTNLVLVAMLSCTALLMERWRQSHGAVLTDVAIAASLLAFTARLALTQFHQQQEISQRIAAQNQLATAHGEVGHLLEASRRQTIEITQISELGSLLQACTSREEVFRLIPERLRRLFPGASGCIALLSPSKNHVASVAKWGVCPDDQIFAPEECWALRRGCTHTHPVGRSEPHCSHLIGEGASVCIPLIASGEAMGTLSIQQDDTLSPISNSDVDSDTFARRRQLAAAVSEHISLALANLNLRETLRLQAVRDPLTGLYNRRYMQEFLERELHAARRKKRPLAVMMLDLDHFKRYNDNFGHSAGDKALAAVGEALQRSVRAEDVACRYGGEEFTLILPECNLQQATVRAEEIRKRLKEFRSLREDKPTDVLTVSIGIAAFDETTDRVDLLLKFADDALYQAKRVGGDRVLPARPAAVLPEADFSEPNPSAATLSAT